ncbi:MAG: monovalent cation/H(+) antiporter subunit G [Planctomycetaceae bacterium]|nr:monovalent cation/H(+) antiporter subunit G [Planctomycetaceae bacterium]
MREQASAVLLVLGAFFMLLAGVGVARLPDLFMRLQAATKASTLGVGCMLMAVAIHFQDLAVTTRAVLVIAFFCLTAPVGAHLIARAAYAAGVPLWEGTITDEMRLSSRDAQDRSGENSSSAGNERGDGS